MAGRGKAVDVILVDVGSAMHLHLGTVARVLSEFALAKTLNKPAHEMAILLYGTTETRNALYEECQEYEHISVLQELRTPNQETLRLLGELSAGAGTSDVIDGFTVIVDLLIKASKERTGLQMVPKKLTVISNFAQEGKEADDDFMSSVTSGFKEHHMQLQLVCMPAPDDATREVQEKNLKILDSLRQETGDRETRFVQRVADLPSVFRLHEVSYQCVKAELEVGKAIRLRLRVYKKCGFEKLPNLKTKAVHGDGLAGITISTASYLAAPEAEDGAAPNAIPEDVVVPPEEQVKAYRYGKQYVPIAEVDNMFYTPGKCLQLLGFVDRKPLLTDQRYLFLGDPSVLLPEQDEAAQVACSGLVQSMAAKDMAAVVRYGRSAKSHVQLCALLPQLGSATIPDHFLMVVLPFSEDMRMYSFPPMVPKPEMQPSNAQYQAAVALVQAMDLTAGVSPPGVPELVKPEETPNPILRRFYTALGKISQAPPDTDYTGKEDQLPGPASEDKLVQEVLQPPWTHFRAGANDKKAAFEQAFTTQVIERTPRKRRGDQAAGEGVGADGDGAVDVGGVVLSDEYPVQDFEAAVAAGKVEAAVAALGSRVNDLVDMSVRNRAYAKAFSCCEAMRRACLEKAEAAPFNTFLQALKHKYRQHDAHSEFWQLVQERKLALLSSTEVASSTVKPEEAKAFLQEQQEQAAAPVQEAEVVDLADDLDDME